MRQNVSTVRSSAAAGLRTMRNNQPYTVRWWRRKRVSKASLNVAGLPCRSSFRTLLAPSRIVSSPFNLSYWSSRKKVTSDGNNRSVPSGKQLLTAGKIGNISSANKAIFQEVIRAFRCLTEVLGGSMVGSRGASEILLVFKFLKALLPIGDGRDEEPWIADGCGRFDWERAGVVGPGPGCTETCLSRHRPATAGESGGPGEAHDAGGKSKPDGESGAPDSSAQCSCL